MRRSLTIPLVFSLTLVASHVSAQKKTTAAEDALRMADQQWLKVFAAKDLDQSLGFCAEDGSVLAPNAPTATGKEAIGKMFAGFFAIPGFGISWEVVRAEVAKSGDLGYTSGKYHMTFNDAAGKPLTDNGKYVTVWKKQSDGSWKVLLDIFNSDVPVAAP